MLFGGALVAGGILAGNYAPEIVDYANKFIESSKLASIANNPTTGLSLGIGLAGSIVSGTIGHFLGHYTDQIVGKTRSKKKQKESTQTGFLHPEEIKKRAREHN